MAYGIVNVKGSAGSSSSGVFLPDVSAVSVTGGNGSISLKWTDPENVVVSGVTMAVWAGTLVVRKIGTVPTNQTDGTVVLNSTTKNSHSTDPFIDTNVVNGTQYFYRFFPYSADGNYTGGTATSAKPSSTVVPVPTITSTHTYNGTAQSPTLNGFDSNIMTKSGDVSAINANESTVHPYAMVISLTDTDAIWADGTYTDKTLTWNIYKADNTPTLSKSSLRFSSGDTDTVTCTALGDGVIIAESLDPSIVTVSSTADSGTAIITVTARNKGGTALAIRVSEGTNYKAGVAYCNISIVRRQLVIPTVTNITKIYNGEEQSPTIEDEPDIRYVTKTGMIATNASPIPYQLIFTINDTTLCEWEDGTSDPKVFNWTINQAQGYVELGTDTVTVSSVVGATTTTTTVYSLSGGELSVTSNTNDSICTASINGSDVAVTKASGTGYGTAVITVTSAATQNYTAASAQLTVIVNQYKIMTVTIDQSNSNPATCCTYADDAVNMTAKSSAWDEFFGHYPCLMAGGVEGKKLNPNNYDKDIDGHTVTINSGSNDVMVAFPRRGLRISTSGNIVTISMTDAPDDPNFEYMAHKRGDTVKDKFYIGAYMGSEVSSKLRSLKGQSIAVNKTIGGFRTLARANSPASNGNGGSGYDQHGWYQLVYLQAMYVLKYKNLNSQSALGRGFVDGNSGQKATGGTETKGMDWGETTGKDHMKLFGIEDLWGNVWSWIDGMGTDDTRRVWTATQGFNDSRTNYVRRSDAIASQNSSGYFSKIVGDTHCGFTPKEWNGSETTYYSDYSHWYADCVLRFSENWDGESRAGMLYLDITFNVSGAKSDVGSRLMYL